MILSINKALASALLVGSSLPSVHSRTLTPQPARKTYVLHEEVSTLLSFCCANVAISSNVPVTVLRYASEGYAEGQGPILQTEAKIAVTSNCDAISNGIRVTLGKDSIDVQIDGADGSGMPFHGASAYSAAWRVVDQFCTPTTSALRGLAARVPESIKALLQRSTPSNAVPLEGKPAATCNVNVEVMMDGCPHGAAVTAPQARVLNTTLDGSSSQQNLDNSCAYDYSTTILPGGVFMEAQASLTAKQMDDGTNMMCMRMVPGRPFVDSTGSTLQASPLIEPVAVVGEVTIKSSEDGDATTCLAESCPPSNNNTVETRPSSTSQGRLLLGQEWTKNAVGEHASIASFAAFSIALMTNGAPADLLQDSLTAAMDEVRHAETSFAIASELTGFEVAPGALPASHHAFGRDVQKLAMAVAREGCVDETLSALEVAAEVDFIDVLLENGAEGTKYAGVDEDVLVWIRDELRTIALEESRHAALAWRTVRWACGVDPVACGAVTQSILNADELDNAFQRRFMPASKAVEAMAKSWRMLYTHIDVLAEVATGSVDDTVEGDSLVSTVANEVLRGVHA